MLLELTLATLTLAPAPGAPVATAIRDIPLDAKGRAEIPADMALSAPGLRFIRAGEQVLYYPADHTLFTWPLVGPGQPSSAEIVVKDHASGWENARGFEAPVEISDKKPRVRFVLPPGEWDLAVVVPGYAPAFANSARLQLATLRPAARLRARVLDARSGKPPDRWDAYIARVVADPESEETKFFAKRPISTGRTFLDFASLPVGGWELKVEVPGKGRRATLVSALKPGGTTDVGDFFISDAGSVRVVLEFPVEVPRGALTVRIAKRPTDPQKTEDVELVSKSALPAAETTVEFADIEPGMVNVKVADAGDLMPRRSSTVVKENEVAEVRLVFVPVRLYGRVTRGDKPIAEAAVSAPQGERIDEKQVMTDDLGNYELRTWTDGKMVAMFTIPPGEKSRPLLDMVPIPEGVTEIEHNVHLPSNTIRVAVHDAETGGPVSGADVIFQGVRTEESGGFGRSELTDQSGRAELLNLTSQRVDVRVMKEGYSTAEVRGVEPKSDGSELDIRLTKGLKLVVVVTDEAGAPLPGATVGIDPDPEWFYYRQKATPADDGRYEFPDTASGGHVLGVMKCGHALAVRMIIVPTAKEGDHIETVQLTTERAPITVHIEDGSGAPVPSASLRWAFNGFPVPLEDWGRIVQSCGQPVRSDSEGNLRLYSFPYGSLAAMPLLGDPNPLGVFTNDGTNTVWTIRLTRDPQAKAEQHAAK
jgi:hypothetical protein